MCPVSSETHSHEAPVSSHASQVSPRIVRACRKEWLDRPPVWLMRQAGRYMAEYRAVREKVSFLGLCKNPELAAEVSMQPINAFGMDAAIMFCDILIPPEAMGMELDFLEKGPVFANPLRNIADINKLHIPDPNAEMGFVMDLLGLMKKELASYPDTGLIGFAGAPWTLASYMIEGGVSRNFTHLKRWMYDEPKALHQLMDKLAQTITLYLNAQIEAGAQVVQLFDTWGGIVSRKHYREFILPYHQQIIEGVNRDKAPLILYVNGSTNVLDMMGEANPDVIGLDWLTSISEAREKLGNRFAIQGNLDTNALFTRPDVLQPMVESMILEGGPEGYIANLGHGILPTTPIENVKLFVDTVKATQFPKP